MWFKNIQSFDYKYCSRENGTLIERRNAASLMGTIYYAPMSAHNFSEQCRKDDLESWFYMIIEMIIGKKTSRISHLLRNCIMKNWNLY